MTVVSDYTAIVRLRDTPTAAWNASVGIGGPVIVSYRFVEQGDLPAPGAVTGAPDSVAAFTSDQRGAFRAALAEAATVAGVIFVETAAPAMINVFGVMGMDSAGRASYPAVSDAFTSEGTFYIDFSFGAALTGRLYEVVLHELGHGLGLSHPHEGGLTLSADRDTSSQTLMSYNDEPTPYDSYRPLDIEALQYLYGPSLGNPGWSLRMEGTKLIATGSDRADKMHGIGGPNDLRGGGGNDRLIGRQDNDTLHGGGGKDRLFGQYGDDVLRGAAGNDRLYGDGDSEYAFGNDRLIGGRGNDSLFGIEGADTLLGGAGHDRLIDGDDDYSQNDLLIGGAGRDTLIAGLGSDTLLGGGGNDVLRGYVRDDRYTGDVLDGGTGNDRLFGSAGFDDFIFVRVAKGDRDTIVGFDLTRDELDFRTGPLDPGTARFEDTAGKDALAILDLGEGEVTLRFKGLTASVLEVNWDFIQA